MRDIAAKYFKEGYSCSESIVQAAIDKGYTPKEFLCAATPFSGGMGVRCLCGSVAGSQIVIGSLYGKNDNSDGMKARKIAKEFNENFAKKYKVNCCKILSSGFEFHSKERKAHCLNIIIDAADILEKVIENAKIEVPSK